MKFLIVDHYYPRFLAQFARLNRELPSLSYEKHLHKLYATQFGTADFYSHALQSFGHEAHEIIINYDLLQEKWAKENGVGDPSILGRSLDYIWSKIPPLAVRKASPRQLAILTAQIRLLKPDVLYVQIPTYLPTSYLREIKQYVKLIVGQIASPIPPLHYFRGFDLMITSLPHFVEKFRQMGLQAEYLPLCFDPRVLQVPSPKRNLPVTFVGSFFAVHRDWLATLSQLAQTTKLKIWGSPAPQLSVYQGEAWGRDMYSILQKSRITLNRHSLVAGDFANNMRLFEATGCGAMLITDAKSNLGELFVPGKEIVVYHDSEELMQQVKYYSQHMGECARIGQAGKQRTLRDHTYLVRMRELIKIIERNL